MSWAADFGPWEGRTWLNCAHQGALPRVAVEEAYEAIRWKITPYEMTTERFSGVPRRVKEALGKLIGAPPEEIVLGNSASYGLHLLANGIPWRDGDEILLVKGDFPSVTLPWLALEQRGVTVRQLEPAASALTADELEQHISDRTRLFCTTWVHSFRGHVLDLDALGRVCRRHGVSFVANTSQALGARPLDVHATPLDAITNVGFKWLCGPYGTGFCWMRPELLASLEYNQAYWLAMQTADDLGGEPRDFPDPKSLGSRRYDVFGTANFFNFKPWAASIEYILAQGVANVAAHDQALVSRFIEGLPPQYQLTSPREGPDRSTLVVLSHQDPTRNEAIYCAMLDAKVHGAFRRGKIRVAPHLYNTAEDIERAVAVLGAEA